MNITIEQLVECIKLSTETKAFKVDATDFYDKRGDLANEYVEVINPATLIDLLENLEV